MSRPTNKERAARRSAEYLQEVRAAVPKILADTVRSIQSAGTTPAVRVQLMQSLERLVNLLPAGALTRPEEPVDDADREFAREAVRRFCIAGDRPLPEVVAELKAGSDIAVAEVETLRVALDEAESLRRRLDEVELRPRAAAAASRGALVKAQDPPAPTADPPAARWEPGGPPSMTGGEYAARADQRRRRPADLDL